MLRKLITKFASSLLHSATSAGYQTRVYPAIGEMIVVHDTLDFGKLATSDQLTRMALFWKLENAFETQVATQNCSVRSLGDGAVFAHNPGNGLPMICDVLDAMGNPYGWDETNTESNI